MAVITWFPRLEPTDWFSPLLRPEAWFDPLLGDPPPAPAYPVVQAVGVKAEGVGSVAPVNEAHVADDVLLVVKEQAESASWSAPAGGWAHVSGSPRAQGSNVTSIGCVWLRATGPGTADASLADPGNHQVAASVVIRGAVTSGTPIDTTSSDGGATTSVSFAGPTTTVDNCLVVYLLSNSTDALTDAFTSVSHSGGLTDGAEVEQWATDQGNGGCILMWAGVKETAGASGTLTATTPGGSWSGIAFAIPPATADTDAAAENVAGTGTAHQPTPSVRVNAECATATGTAHDATVSTTSGTNAAAEAATVTATAHQPAASVRVNAGAATATGTAHQPATAVKPNAAAAAATGTAHQPASSVKPNAAAAAATATAHQPTPSVRVNAECATATGTAHNPTVATGSATSASAEAATATGTAHQPTTAVRPTTGTAAAAAAAVQPGASVRVNAGVASVSAAAAGASSGVGARPSSATVSAAALSAAANIRAAATLAEVLAEAHPGTVDNPSPPNGTIGPTQLVAAGGVVVTTPGAAVGGVQTGPGGIGGVVVPPARGAPGVMG